MREIKFRGWNGETMDYHALGAKINPAFTEFGIDFPACYSPYWSTRNHTVLMQFTGILDKNGKEIYEGDIVKVNNRSDCEVYWAGCGFFMKNTWRDESLDYVYDLVEGKLMVIGNIYENPELLKPECN